MSQSEKTKSKLISSAKKIFSEKGYYDTKVSDIVKEAGVAQGTFYLYFKSKEEIFKEIILDIKTNIENILSKYEKSQDSVEQTIIKLKGEVTTYLYTHKEIARIFLFQLFTMKEFIEIYFEIIKKFENTEKALIEKAVKEGTIKYKNVDNLANILLGYGRRLFEDEVLLKNKPLEEVLNLQKEGLKIIFKGAVE
jgi:AcrR family transcriptional regulator